MAKKGYHSLFKKSKSSSGVKTAAKKKSKPQAARAESTFKRQPKAQKQARITKDEKQQKIVQGAMFLVDNPLAHKAAGLKSIHYDASVKEGEELKKKREKEKKKRTKASGGTRQSQKRKQGGY